MPSRTPSRDLERPGVERWQIIAPATPGALPIRFEYKKAGDATGLPLKIFTLTVITH